jgi:hypothetical protein
MDEPEAASRSGRRCRSARGSTTIAGQAFRRSAVFYMPDPPAGEALPTDTTRLAERVCLLGSVWLRSPEKDSAQGAELHDSLKRFLTASLGPATNTAEISGLGTGLWSNPQSWRSGRSVVVLADDAGRSSSHSSSVTRSIRWSRRVAQRRSWQRTT